MPLNPFQPNVLNLANPKAHDPIEDSLPTTTAQDVVEVQNEKPEEVPDLDPKIKKRNDEFRQRIDAAKTHRRKLISNWTVSIDYRRGKPFTSQADSDQIAVNLDWSLTKNKQAKLFSQVPEARINHGEDLLLDKAPWIGSFQNKLNDALVAAGIESAMDECLPDCINAAGIGVVLVSYEAIMEDKEVPSIDISQLPPEIGAQVMKTGQFNGQEVPMETVPTPADHRYVVQRVSPADLLWPVNFTGANFDKAPWIGRTGRITWTEGVQQFKLTEADKDSILGEDRPMMDRLTHDVERDKASVDDMVGFDEIFFHEFQYIDGVRNYSTIHHLVFVNGKEDPVIDEPWKGQKYDEEANTVIGAQRYPIRILTLAYLTDEAIPPSDSAIGRPQVNEINKARGQMIKQREHSLPVRWFDVNRLDPAVQQGLMRGTWQSMIPVQGDGGRVIGEVARANMPIENHEFYKYAKNDLHEQWTTGPNQLGSGNEVETKGEANDIQAGIAVPQLRERAKVASFFVGIAEVLGGLICLYEDAASIGEGFDPSFSTTLKYTVLADSTVLLDSNQRLGKLYDFVNKNAKSGWVNIEPVLQEIAILSGLDPKVVIKAPTPAPPVEPNISLRLTGTEDVLNSLTLAFLIKSGQAPTPEQIEQAKSLIQQAVTPPAGLQLQSGMPGPGAAPMMPVGVNPPGPPLPPPVAGPPPGTPPPMPMPPKMGEAHPEWSSMPMINKRTESGGIQ